MNYNLRRFLYSFIFAFEDYVEIDVSTYKIKLNSYFFSNNQSVPWVQ